VEFHSGRADAARNGCPCQRRTKALPHQKSPAKIGRLGFGSRDSCRRLPSCHNHDPNCRDDWPKGQLYGGAITLAAGAALGVTGLVIWRRNVHAVVDEASPAPPAGAAARLRLLPVAGLRWAGLGLTGNF